MVERGFTIEGGYYDPKCQFCGKRYDSPGIQASFKAGIEICPSCLLKGPAVVAKEVATSKKRPAYAKSFAAKFAGLRSFRDLPGGILAIKIAEAYMEGSRASEIGLTWISRAEYRGLADRAKPRKAA